MKLLCQKCRAPLDYAHETQRCESCGWQSNARPSPRLRIPESDPVWVDPAQIPELFRAAYGAVREQLTSGGPFLSCALTLSPLIRQLISLPVLAGGSLLAGSGVSLTLPLSPSLSLSGWVEAINLLLSKAEVHRHPLLESLLFETRAFAQQAEARPFLSGGMFSLSYPSAKKNLAVLLKSGGQLLLQLSEPYRKIKLRPASGSDAGLQFILDGKKYPLQGARREGETLFILTHGLGGKTAGCSAVGEARYGILPLPDFFSYPKTEEPVPSFAQIPRNPSLLRPVRRAMDSGFTKGRILLRTALEMGTPGIPEAADSSGTSSPTKPAPARAGQADTSSKFADKIDFFRELLGKAASSPESAESADTSPEITKNSDPSPEALSGTSEPLTILYDARESRMDGASALFKAVSDCCRPDSDLLDTLTALSSDALLTLLIHLRKTENRSILLVVANAGDYTDFSLPLERLLPETGRLPDGVVLVLHSADPAFAFPADLDIDLPPEDAGQNGFLRDYLSRHYPFFTLTPKKRGEETDAVLAAAGGSFSPVFLYAAFGGFRQRPRRADLLAGGRPEELFLHTARVLYGEFLDSAGEILSLCHSAALPCTPAGVARLFPALSPWLIETVLGDLPLLSRYHLPPLAADSPDTLQAVCDRYLAETGTETSPRTYSNRFRAVAAFGTDEQKQALKKSPPLRSNMPEDFWEEAPAVRRCLYETLLFSGETRAETQPAARSLLSLYEEEDAFSAWLFAQRLLTDEQAEPLTKRAAAVVCATLLFEQGADGKALSLLKNIPGGEPKSSTPEASLLSFRVHALQGELHCRQGEHAAGLVSLEQALSLLPNGGLSFLSNGVLSDGIPDEKTAARAARAHDLCGAILLGMEEPGKALVHFTEAAKLWERLPHDNPQTEGTTRLVASLIQSADCQSLLELDAEALESYRRAEALLLPAETDSDALSARLHQAKANLYEHNADTAHALEERSRALDFHEKLIHSGKETAEPLCRTLQQAAQDALSLGYGERALRYLDTALILAKKMTVSRQLEDPEWLEELQNQRADAQDAAGGAQDYAGETPANREMNPLEKGGKPLKSEKNGKETFPIEPVLPPVPLEELRLQSKTASAFLKEKKYAAAIDTLLPLLDSLENLPPEEEAEGLQTLALSYVGAQRTEEGMPCLERLVKHLETATVSDSLLDAYAHVFSSMGMVYRTRRKNEKALESYSRAIALWQQGQASNQSIDENRLASAYVNRSVLLTDRKQFSRAVEDLKRAIALREGMGSEDRNGLARLYLNLGYVYGQYGEMEHALAYNQKAVALRDELYRQGEVSAAELARSYLNLGILLGGDKQLDGEIQNYGVAIDLLEALSEQTPEGRGLLVKLYRYRAMSYQLQNLPDEQKADLEKADGLEALTRR